jgi:hypothetical protein
MTGVSGQPRRQRDPGHPELLIPGREAAFAFAQ